jgi:hypothetical protein
MGDYGTSSLFQYTELLLDSGDAVNGGDVGSAINDWPKFYFTSKQPNIACIKVLQAEIPFVFDTINHVNNTLIYVLTGIPHTITVPTGNYNGSTLAGYLQTAIQTITAGFTVTYNSTTRFYTFTMNSNNAWGLTFNGLNNLHFSLGFLPNTSYAANGPGSTIVSGAAAITGGNYLQLNSQTIGAYIECNTVDSSPGGGVTPVIARIPINAGPNELITYTDPSPTMWFDYIGNNIDNFDLYLTLNRLASDTPLEMKNANWSVKLGILSYREGAIEKGAPVIGKTL